MKNCPTCKREFTKFTDYPLIKNVKFDFPSSWANSDQTPEMRGWFRLPLEKETALLQIAENEPLLQDYLLDLKDTLRKGSYRALASHELLPQNLSKDSYFTRVYVVHKPKDRGCESLEDWIYLSLQEEKLDTIEVVLLVPGPNLGSAGGATLMQLGTLATITYEGVIQ